MRQNHVGRWLMVVVGVGALALQGCASKAKHGPFPADPDPCATYCPKWVEPVYRDVPCLVAKKPGRCVTEKVPVQKVVFEEVVVPGRYEKKCTPDVCRQFGAVEVEPARDEWVRVKCQPACGGCAQDCWKQIRIPAKFEWCEKTVTEKGIAYCAFTPPEYEVRAKTVQGCEKVERYVPPEYEVVWKKELFQPGHWSWETRYDCAPPQHRCPPTGSCAPGGSPSPRGDFSRCPCKD